jgi:hypothetical protein
MRLFIVLIPVTLCSCIASPKGRHEGEVTQTAPSVVLDLKDVVSDKAVQETATRTAGAAADVAAAKAALTVHTDIENRMKTVQDNMTSLIGGKIDEIGKLIDIKNTLSAKMDNQIYADLKVHLQNSIEAMATINAAVESSIRVSAEFRAQVQAQFKALSDFNASLAGQVDGLTGQAGVNNRIQKTLETIQQDIKASAGRDVNMLPPQAVEVMMDQNKTFYMTIIGIMGAIKVLALAAFGYIYRNARLREENRTKLLMVALGKMQPEDAEEIKNAI